MAAIDQSTVGNRLLRALPEQAFAALRPHLTALDLPLRYVLTEANEPNEFVYFIESGLGSVVATSSDDERIEVGHVGREGLGGYHVVLMTDRTPNRTFMQTPGTGFSVPVPAFLDILDKDKAARDFFLRYVQSEIGPTGLSV